MPKGPIIVELLCAASGACNRPKKLPFMLTSPFYTSEVSSVEWAWDNTMPAGREPEHACHWASDLHLNCQWVSYIAGILIFLGYAGFKSKPFPDALLKKKYSSKQDLQSIFFMAHASRCSGDKAEVWIGSHVVLGWDHSKIWVISWNPDDEHKAFSNQKVKLIPLWYSRVPVDYMGDKGCTEFFSIGAEKSFLSVMISW
jgi:hypothetical protein